MTPHGVDKLHPEVLQGVRLDYHDRTWAPGPLHLLETHDADEN